MPVAPQFQIVQMRELCDQLKIAPEHIRRKQMDACELLASEIESEHLYPLDYVIFLLTGYRTESVDQPMLLGDPLRNDLVAHAYKGKMYLYFFSCELFVSCMNCR